jgi:hypothetical protein
MTINFGVFCLGQASPYFQALYEARVAAFIVWQVISEVHFFSYSTCLYIELLSIINHTIAIENQQ